MLGKYINKQDTNVIFSKLPIAATCDIGVRVGRNRNTLMIDRP